MIARALQLKESIDILNLQMCRDIDKQKRNYYRILQSIPEGVMIFDKTFNNIEFANT